ncbi:regulator of microtubule dynamics protein 1-like [Trichogramma pretiosum]|uniref:regulator of microtubule dynamics protein 1-like n=1 Tax=Trichogramma pretiosum TaxID=7493 RepID=UPI0006C98199|nr:regulator of microtubule dynamics protein 1-like [Trichogramma pretiosum]
MFSRFMKYTVSRIQQRALGYVFNGLRRSFGEKLRQKSIGPAPIYIAALWGISKKKDDDKSLTNKELLLAKADALFDQEEYHEIYKLLKGYKENRDVEILWRLSRTLYKMSKLEKQESEAKRLIYEAYDLINLALEIKEDHWAVHKWVAILLNDKTNYEGTKIKIKELNNIKQHMLRASELNPKDATTLYLLGNWCYQVTDLPWFQRKIVSTIFSEPPTSTFEEALQYFEKAEHVDPNFYGHNLLMLGKTYLKLNKKEDAMKYLKLASEYPAKNDDDQEAKQEAQKILNNL